MAKTITKSAINFSKTVISNGRNDVFSDQNINEGGEDLGLCPTELLIGALSSCAMMSMRVYALRKEIPLETIEIEAELTRNDNNTSHITKRIKLEGKNLSNEDKMRLMKIADLCFVQKVLSNPIAFESIQVE